MNTLLLIFLNLPLVFLSPLTFEAEKSIRKRIFDDCHASLGFYNHSLDVGASLFITKLVKFDQLNEEMTIFATLTFSWHDKCLEWMENGAVFKNFDQDIAEQFINLSHVSFPSNELWHPKVLQVSSMDDLLAVDKNGQHLTINFFPNGFVEWSPMGPFTSHCELKLKKFPKDTQRCLFAFQLWDTELYTNFTSTSVSVPDDNLDKITSDLLIWKVVQLEHDIARVCWTMSTPPKVFCATEVRFWINVERKWEGYLFTIFLPTICLSILQLSPLAMPALPDRPSYSVTVLLAFAVINQLVQNDIPQTAETIDIVMYIGVNIVMGTICTLYSAISVHLAQKLKNQNVGKFLRNLPIPSIICWNVKENDNNFDRNGKSRIFDMSVIQLIDFIVGFSMACVIVIANIVLVAQLA